MSNHYTVVTSYLARACGLAGQAVESAADCRLRHGNQPDYIHGKLNTEEEELRSVLCSFVVFYVYRFELHICIIEGYSALAMHLLLLSFF